MDGGSILAFAKQVHTGLGKELHVLNYRLQESESELATLKKEEADRTRYLANLEIANRWLQQLVEQINTENINKIHLLVNQALGRLSAICSRLGVVCGVSYRSFSRFFSTDSPKDFR